MQLTTSYALTPLRPRAVYTQFGLEANWTKADLEELEGLRRNSGKYPKAMVVVSDSAHARALVYYPIGFRCLANNHNPGVAFDGQNTPMSISVQQLLQWFSPAHDA